MKTNGNAETAGIEKPRQHNFLRLWGGLVQRPQKDALLLQCADRADDHAVVPAIGEIPDSRQNHLERRWLHAPYVYFPSKLTERRGTFANRFLATEFDLDKSVISVIYCSINSGSSM